MTDEIIIRLQNISKRYKDTIVFENLNLEVKKGEFLGIMGPSGCGKSTTLHIIGGIDEPSDGEVFIFNKSLKTMSEKEKTILRKQHISFVFQFYYLLEDFNVLENITLFGKKEKALELIKFLRLEHRINHRPYELSGGEQQRVAIARALIKDPSILIADEPTGNLDYSEAKKIFSLLKALNQEKNITIIVATHNEELKPFFDNIFYIKGA